LALLLWVISLGGRAVEASEFSLRWTTNGAGDQALSASHAVELRGLKPGVLQALRVENWPLERWQQVLPVRIEQGGLFDGLGVPPMLGRYRIAGDALRFEPRYPLEPGFDYQATFQPSALPEGSGLGSKLGSGLSLTARLRLPPRAGLPRASVARVYPSSQVLPENLLKFYLHFSTPMSRGWAYEHVRLQDASGRAAELPFLELNEELWNPEQTRLTLILDPGRIKRGLRPLEEAGPIFEAGQQCTLVITPGWPDAQGQPTAEAFAKTFTVGPADRATPDPARWEIVSPAAGTRDPLALRFDEPLDHALASRVIQVTAPGGQLILGQAALLDHERRWQFIPESPWPAAATPCELRIPRLIEDLAGNNIGKPFDLELTASTAPPAPSAAPQFVTLPFAPK